MPYEIRAAQSHKLLNALVRCRETGKAQHYRMAISTELFWNDQQPNSTECSYRVLSWSIVLPNHACALASFIRNWGV